jgi:hypothetical protein
VNHAVLHRFKKELKKRKTPLADYTLSGVGALLTGCQAAPWLAVLCAGGGSDASGQQPTAGPLLSSRLPGCRQVRNRLLTSPTHNHPHPPAPQSWMA